MKNGGSVRHVEIRFVYILIICSTLASSARGQIYLITGSPTPKHEAAYTSALVRVDDDGSIGSIDDLVPPKAGTDWIAISYEGRKAVIVPREPERRLAVVDLDSALVVKRCELPVPSWSLIWKWLASVPGKGLSFDWVEGVAGPVRRFILDPAISCGDSFAPVVPSDIRFIVAHGTAGVADIAPNDTVPGMLTKDGEFSEFVANTLVTFEFKIPPEFLDAGDPHAAVVINNSEILVLGISRDRLLLFHKANKSWRPITIPGGGSPSLRGFGHFIAITEIQKKSASHPESSGRTEWRKADGRMGPDLDARFADAEFVWPGRLYLYDVSRDRLYSIITNQADSEVLLIERKKVYYRTSNHLYSADIADKSIENTRLLVTSELVRDSHWAFVKR